jgi:hypothetical protein
MLFKMCALLLLLLLLLVHDIVRMQYLAYELALLRCYIVPPLCIALLISISSPCESVNNRNYAQSISELQPNDCTLVIRARTKLSMPA